MGNHWNDSGDFVIEEKTLFRQVGWIDQTANNKGDFYPMGTDMRWCSVFAPVYQQIATWVDGEGWKD